MYIQICMHVHTYFDRKSHCSLFVIPYIHVIKNNNECNLETKGNAVKHNVKKFGYYAGKSVAKFSES